MRAMVYHFVIYLGKKIHTQFHHRNIQSSAEAICQVRSNYVYFLKTKIVYITSERSVIFLQPELTQYPVVSIHFAIF